MEVVAGAAAVVCKAMMGAVLDVLVTALKQNPYTLHCPVQHSLCTSAAAAWATAHYIIQDCIKADSKTRMLLWGGFVAWKLSGACEH